jgi:2-keto-3-deoxy-L-arabinonate dehydratase
MSSSTFPILPSSLPCGIVPSVNTPFTAENKIDTDALIKLVDYSAASGVAGFLCAAVAAEHPSFTAEERSTVVRTVVSRADKHSLPVIVGVTSDDPDVAIARAREAREVGAKLVNAQFPPHLRGAYEEAEREARLGAQADFLDALGRAFEGPLMLQDFDPNGGAGLPVADIVELRKRVPCFSALKIETVPAGPKYSAVLAATGGTLHVSGGWAAGQMLDALRRGVHAFIPTGMEPLYCEVVRRFKIGDGVGAASLFDRMALILSFSNQHVHVSIRFFKLMRHRAGLFVTPDCREPVPLLDELQLLEAHRMIDMAKEMELELRNN